MRCYRFAHARTSASYDASIHADREMRVQRATSTFATNTSRTTRIHTKRDEKVVQIYSSFSIFSLGVRDGNAFQRKVTQQPARSSIGCVDRTKKAPLVWKKLSNRSCLHFHKERPTMNGSKMGVESQKVQPFGNTCITRLLHLIQSTHGRNISSR